MLRYNFKNTYNNIHITRAKHRQVYGVIIFTTARIWFSNSYMMFKIPLTYSYECNTFLIESLNLALASNWFAIWIRCTQIMLINQFGKNLIIFIYLWLYTYTILDTFLHLCSVYKFIWKMLKSLLVLDIFKSTIILHRLLYK